MKLRTFPKIKEVLNFGLTKNWPLCRYFTFERRKNEGGKMDDTDGREKASKELHWFNPHADRGCWLIRLFPVS